MRAQALTWIFAGGLLAAAAPAAAEPLADLAARLAGLRSDQPVRLEVEVEVEHRGSAPLHLNDTKQRGTAVVVAGRRGVRVRDERWIGRATRLSLWRSGPAEPPSEPMIDDLEAADLIDPAGALTRLLADASLVSDEPTTWEGRPARLLRLHVTPPEITGRNRVPVKAEALVWLDENGDPLALERTGELKLGAALTLVERQLLTFRLDGGRLLADELRQTSSGNALAVLSGQDDKRMRVVAVR